MIDQEAQTLANNVQQRKQKVYGNLKVLIDTDLIHLSLGPDYVAFISAFMGLLFIECLMVYIVYRCDMGQRLLMTSYIITGLSLLIYLIIALSNPGIYDPLTNIQPKTKYCNTCKTFIPKTCRHCLRCDLCIDGYDHHCPWTSKCIGKKNLTLFYIFCTIVPISLIYWWIVIIYSLLTLYSSASK